MLNLAAHFSSGSVRPALLDTRVDQLTKILRGAQVIRYQLTGVAIVQFIQREAAPIRNLYAFIQKRAWINALQDRLGFEVSLCVGRKCVLDGGDGFLTPYCRQCVLQGLTHPDVHMHISGCNQRHAGLSRQILQGLLMRVVTAIAWLLKRKPDPAGHQFLHTPGMLKKCLIT